MPIVPQAILKKLYVRKSLRTEGDSISFKLKNIAAPATITNCHGINIDGQAIENDQITIISPQGKERLATKISKEAPFHFPIGATVKLRVTDITLDNSEPHNIKLHLEVEEIGPIDISISDTIARE